MRPEDEMMRRLRGGNPMDIQGPPMPPDAGPMPPMPPGEMGAPMGDPMMGDPMMDQMQDPMMQDPMMDEVAMEASLPQTAVVDRIEGDSVTVTTEDGRTIQLPMSAFPIPPGEGMSLMQATVADVTDSGILVMVEGEQIEIPQAQLMAEFNIGDYFWMPMDVPTAPDELIDIPMERL